MPWLPMLITTLRSGGAESAPLLIREAGRVFPGRLPELDRWVPPWLAGPAPAVQLPASGGSGGAELPAAHPATCDAVAELLGCTGGWPVAEPSGAALLGGHPDTARAVAELLG